MATDTHPIDFPTEPGLYESALFPVRETEPPYTLCTPYALAYDGIFHLLDANGARSMKVQSEAIRKIGPYRRLDGPNPEPVIEVWPTQMQMLRQLGIEHYADVASDRIHITAQSIEKE